MTEITTRADAMAAGLKRYFTGKPCKNGHVAERLVSNATCLRCAVVIQGGCYRRNPSAQKARADRWLATNYDLHMARSKANYEANKDRRLEQANAWATAHPEKVRQAKRQWKANNPDKVKIAQRVRDSARRANGGSFSKTDIDFLMTTQKARCLNCKRKLGTDYHVDHVLPVAKGGSSYRHNIQLLCPPCNQRKSAKDPIRWAQENGRLL